MSDTKEPEETAAPAETAEERTAREVNAANEAAAEAAASAAPEAAEGDDEVATSIVLPVKTVEDVEAEAQPSRRDADDADAEGYDPGADNIDDVLAYVDSHPDEADRVLAAEKAGKNRTTLVSQLEAR